MIAMTVHVATFRSAVGRRRSSVAAYYARNRPTIHVVLLACLFFGVISLQWVLVTIPAGHVGVMWYRLLGGTDTVTVYGEGLRFVFPWDQMTIYDARLQNAGHDFDVLTRDGLSMTVNVVVQFRLNQRMVGRLHKTIGPNYVDSLLMPAIGGDVREIISRNSTDEVYTTRRSDIQEEARSQVAAGLVPPVDAPGAPMEPWLFVDAVVIRSMQFPPDVQSAVNRKMEQYQLREEYRYRLEREKLESERKQVEAQGIANFQQIVGAGISENYLKWKGIDATLALAQSANAKVVVIGAGKDGMPLILGDTSGREIEGATSEASPRAEVSQTNIPPDNAGQAAAVGAASDHTSWASPSTKFRQ
jgi:regulator of protease activity HflC (stomatin/prohibitin superfamily)